MRHIARLAIRRPVPILIFWVGIFLVALLLAGKARDNLHETHLQIPGPPPTGPRSSPSSQFGGSIAIAILLKAPEGTSACSHARAERLVRRLERIQGVDVLSPFAVGGDRRCASRPNQALLTLQVQQAQGGDLQRNAARCRSARSTQVRTPLQAEVSGRAPLVRALNDASLDSLDKGERIAFPILIVLLLLVFRSPIAALIPLACGLLVTRIGMALMGVAERRFALDALALNMLTMIGLALGVDYSLLIVSRFSEELAAGRERRGGRRAGRGSRRAHRRVRRHRARGRNAGRALHRARRAARVGDARRDRRLRAGRRTALFAIPAGLAVLGTNVNRWQLWSARRENPWVRLSERVSRQALASRSLLTMFPLLLLSAPALALDTGPPNVENLPPGQRVAQELRGIPARSRRRLGDAVRGRLPDRRADHDRGSGCGALKRFQHAGRPASPGSRRCSGPARCSSAPRCCAA